MPNNTVSDWSTTPASNTEVGGVDLAENSMRPRDVNNAIRTVMAQIASGILAWPTTTIELGHATDTTLSRGAAGFMAVEGKRVPAPASQAAGDILYRGSTEWERLAKGTALQVLRQNNALTAPEWATAREVLTANRTYYVRTDGSDSNTGLVDSAGGAFLTLQKAYNVITGSLDLAGFTVTVDVGDATYTAGLSVTQPWTGGGAVTFLGNTSTPANVVISITGSTSAISNTATLPGELTFIGMQVASSAGYGVLNNGAGTIVLSQVNTAACGLVKLFAAKPGSIIRVASGYTDSGNAIRHFDAEHGAFIQANSVTITLSGTPAYSGAFAYASDRGGVEAVSVTFSGSATGPRYSASTNAVINTAGGGASYFPGNSVGATATGGQYV